MSAPERSRLPIHGGNGTPGGRALPVIAAVALAGALLAGTLGFMGDGWFGTAAFRRMSAMLVGPLAALPDPPHAQADVRAEWLEGLQALLEQEAMRIDGRVYVHVRLADGRTAGVRADEPIDGASVIKLPVMAALYHAWETGRLRRTEADERRCRAMITRSRNGVTNELLRTLTMEEINSWLTLQGYSTTRLRAYILQPEPYGPNTVTAAEMTRMLEQIERGELVSPTASAEMRDMLLSQHWRTRIPAGLPPGVTVGNKTGTMNDLLHDVAFVEAPGGLRYTIAVLIEREHSGKVKSDAIAALSRRVYEYLTRPAPGAPANLAPAVQSQPAGG